MAVKLRFTEKDLIAAVEHHNGNFALYIWDDEKKVWDRMRQGDAERLIKALEERQAVNEASRGR